MAELEQELGGDWVRTYDGELTPSTLAKVLAEAHGRPPRRCEALARFDWEPLAERTMEAFQTALRGHRPAHLPVEERARA
jgi:hypothetical protein